MSGSSYTERYGLSYEEWAERKAERIRDALAMFYRSGAPVDLQILVERMYRERLMRMTKESWKPVDDRFTDFKPSPFIKNFTSYLIGRLVEDGYISYGWTVEAYDRIRSSDEATPLDVSKARIYSYGIHHRYVEVCDGLSVHESSVEARPPDVRVTRRVGAFIVEARDSTRVSDETVKPEATFSRATKTIYSRRVLRIPSIDYLKDLCIWRDPR